MPTKSIHYFISDAHLGVGAPSEEAPHVDRLCRFLKHINEPGNGLTIVGDLFDFWFEYRTAIPRRYFQVLFQLKQLTENGVNIDYIAGNHDFPFMSTEGAAVDEMFQGFSEGEEIGNLVYLRDNTINAADHGFEPLVIHGSPWQPWFHDWAFNFPRDPGEYEKFANRVYSLIPEDVDVLITHGPPRKILDGPPFRRIPADPPNKKPIHNGCRHLLRHVLKLKPRIHAFGHVHTGRGTHETKDTLFINCAVIEPQTYLLKHGPVVVDLVDGIPSIVDTESE